MALLDFKNRWARDTMGTPHHDIGKQIVEGLLSALTETRCLQLDMEEFKGFRSLFPEVADDDCKFFVRLVDDLISHGQKYDSSPLAVCGRTGNAGQSVTSAFRGLQRSAYAPLRGEEPFIALIEVPATEEYLGTYRLSIEMNAPAYPSLPLLRKHTTPVRISATPIGWSYGPVVEPDNLLIMFTHVHGTRLWYEIPPNDINKEIMNEYTVDQLISALPAIMDRLVFINWAIISHPTTFRMNSNHYYGFLSLETSFHVSADVVISKMYH